MDKFEYFRGTAFIYGKHASLADDLHTLNQIQSSYFKRLVDLYTIAPVVGLRANRKAEISTDTEVKRQVLLEQILTRRDDLLTVMQMILLLDESDGLTVEQRVDRAFRGPQNEEEYNANVKLFNEYLCGGIEVLHEELVQRPLSMDDYPDKKIGNIMAIFDKQFDEDTV